MSKKKKKKLTTVEEFRQLSGGHVKRVPPQDPIRPLPGEYGLLMATSGDRKLIAVVVIDENLGTKLEFRVQRGNEIITMEQLASAVATFNTTKPNTVVLAPGDCASMGLPVVG
jgi:hypothetical protein